MIILSTWSCVVKKGEEMKLETKESNKQLYNVYVHVFNNNNNNRLILKDTFIQCDGESVSYKVITVQLIVYYIIS